MGLYPVGHFIRRIFLRLKSPIFFFPFFVGGGGGGARGRVAKRRGI